MSDNLVRSILSGAPHGAPTAPLRYERVLFNDHHGNRCSALLVNPEVQTVMFTGLELSCLCGDEADDHGTRTGRRHVIATELITSRSPRVIDRHHGTLKAVR